MPPMPMSVTAVHVCEVCRLLPPRFQIRDLKLGKVGSVCSAKCMLSWCWNFNVNRVQTLLRQVFKTLPKGN